MSIGVTKILYNKKHEFIIYYLKNCCGFNVNQYYIKNYALNEK